MGRRRIGLKLKRRPRDLKKEKVGILCDFCGFSTRYGRDHMESELKRLRVLTRRMTGKDLDGLSFTELVFLENHLREVVLPVVKKKKEQLEEDLERLRIQSETVDEYGGRMIVAPCRFSSTNNSSGEIQVGEAAAMSKSQIEFERRKAESMEMEFERLWLLKEYTRDYKTCGSIDLHQQGNYSAKSEVIFRSGEKSDFFSGERLHRPNS